MAASCAPPPLPPGMSSTPAQTPSAPTFRVQAIYFAKPAPASAPRDDTRLLTVQAQQEILSHQLDNAFAQAAAHIHAGDALLDERNPLEAVREYERARILIEQQIDPVIANVSSQSSIQGENHILSTSKIQAANVLRADMLNRVNRSYNFREMYVEQQELDKVNQLRKENRLVLQPLPASPSTRTMTRTIQEIPRVDQRSSFSNVGSQRFSGDVEQYISRLQRRGEDFARCLLRADQYFPHVTSLLASERVPEFLAYIALIESGYQPSAKSSADEAGLWLLSRATARQYGLRVNASVDERFQIDASTRAFARYMKELYGRFGSWERAITGYAPTERDFLAKLHAAIAIANEPQAYGFHLNLPHLARQKSFQNLASQSTVFLEPPIGMGTTY